MHPIRKIISILPRRERKYILLLLVLMLIGGSIEACGIGGILPLLSIIGDAAFLSSHPTVAAVLVPLGVTTHKSLIIAAALALICVYIVKECFLALETRYQTAFVARMQSFFAHRLMEVYLAKPYIYHVNHNTAEILRNVGSGPAIVFSGICIPLCQFFTESITAAIICLMLVCVDPSAAVIVASVLGTAVFLVIRVFRRRVARRGTVVAAAQTEYTKWLNQGLGAVKETKILHRERFFAQAYGDAYRTYARSQGTFTFLNLLPRLFIELVVVGALVLLIIVKAAGGADPASIVSILGLLALAAFRLMPSANRIIGYYNNIKYQMSYFHAIYPELREIRAATDAGRVTLFPGADAPLPFTDAIRVEHLSFHYPEAPEQEILDDVSFAIPAGKFVGIVGPSGAGKTTFVDLLLGLLSPTGGRITVDGVDIADHMQAWQENLAYVPQSIYLIDGTILENVALGLPKEEIDEQRVIRALQMAELYDYVQTMKDGIHTSIGERGIKLSGGQQQRIGIARALYQEPTILVLDEATSALDSVTEAAIQASLEKLSRGRTTIVVAHRLATVRGADHIAVIDKEGVSEYGTHKELMEKNGLYAALWNTQRLS